MKYYFSNLKSENIGGAIFKEDDKINFENTSKELGYKIIHTEEISKEVYEHIKNISTLNKKLEKYNNYLKQEVYKSVDANEVLSNFKNLHKFNDLVAKKVKDTFDNDIIDMIKNIMQNEEKARKLITLSFKNFNINLDKNKEDQDILFKCLKDLANKI